MEEINNSPEASPTNEPFDELKLLELAKSEGLADALEEQVDIIDPAAPIELSESDQALLSAAMETILFMSDRPVSLPKLRSVINSEVPLTAYRQLMTKLRDEFSKDHRGIEIAEVSLGFQLRTKPQMGQILRKMVKTQPLKLSPTTMEVLAIIAYKQPVTKDEVDLIRGVDSGYVLRNLMEKRLIRISGRSDLPGKPMLYGTTHEFLELFCLKDLKAMPSLHEVESMVAASEVGFEEKRQLVMDEFSKVVANSTKILFDDSSLDEELEAIRNEIASVSTSTPFIEEQKAKEKLDAALAEQQPLTEHSPSPELMQAAADAQWERHAEMISQAVAETTKQEQGLDAPAEQRHAAPAESEPESSV